MGDRDAGGIFGQQGRTEAARIVFIRKAKGAQAEEGLSAAGGWLHDDGFARHQITEIALQFCPFGTGTIGSVDLMINVAGILTI